MRAASIGITVVVISSPAGILFWTGRENVYSFGVQSLSSGAVYICKRLAVAEYGHERCSKLDVGDLNPVARTFPIADAHDTAAGEGGARQPQRPTGYHHWAQPQLGTRELAAHNSDSRVQRYVYMFIEPLEAASSPEPFSRRFDRVFEARHDCCARALQQRARGPAQGAGRERERSRAAQDRQRTHARRARRGSRPVLHCSRLPPLGCIRSSTKYLANVSSLMHCALSGCCAVWRARRRTRTTLSLALRTLSANSRHAPNSATTCWHRKRCVSLSVARMSDAAHLEFIVTVDCAATSVPFQFHIRIPYCILHVPIGQMYEAYIFPLQCKLSKVPHTLLAMWCVLPHLFYE